MTPRGWQSYLSDAQMTDEQRDLFRVSLLRYKLSNQQCEFVVLLLLGYSTKEAANEMNITHTYSWQVQKHIAAKVGVQGQGQTVMMLRLLGIGEPNGEHEGHEARRFASACD